MDTKAERILTEASRIVVYDFFQAIARCPNCRLNLSSKPGAILEVCPRHTPRLIECIPTPRRK